MKPSNKQIAVKLLYVCVALFVLAALVLQVLGNLGRLPATLPLALPTFISVAALIVALGVFMRRLWVIDRLLAREMPQRAPSIFPDHPLHEIMRLYEAETERAVKISSLSHELRTPLTSINGFSELLMQDDTVSGEAREFATLIHSEAQRLTSMVNTVLTEAQLAADITTSDE
ncbi:MAG: two-component system, OmpR family, phosphate regulon sensor histidine kinase PhoR [Acidobacteriota bacterium]|nr:two-component system, OmpR family, phosphate regulon sensor histidine kinase PhoR [Acidobacteriota bacterium]